MRFEISETEIIPVCRKLIYTTTRKKKTPTRTKKRMKATFNQKQKKTNAPTMQQRNRAFLETSSKHLEVMQQKNIQKA